MASIELPKEKIRDFCERHRVSKLSIFGSVLREDFKPSSDIDILVEFKKDAEVGFFDLAAMELELSELLGYKVDLRTADELSRYFRDEVIKTAEVQYVSG